MTDTQPIPSAIENFLIERGYEPHNVDPILCVQSGSRAYDLHCPDSDRDYIAVHLAATSDILEHPDFRVNSQVIRKRFDKELNEIPDGVKGGDISLDSFEMWKFVTLWLKGAPVAHELLFMEPVDAEPGCENIFSLMKEGISNRLGRATRGMVLHNWKKHKTDRKRTVIAYYRLLQTIFFLRENRFGWNANDLWSQSANLISGRGHSIKDTYTNFSTRKIILSEEETGSAEKDLMNLIDQVDRAMIVTKLPDQVPRKYLDEVLKLIKKSRSEMIQERST